MHLTALRSVPKISSNVLQNSRRLFSFKFEMTPASRIVEQEEAKPAQVPVLEEAPKPAPGFRYNVCQPRTSPVERVNMIGDMSEMQRQSVRAAIEEQHLQPSMLPEYYQKQMEKNRLVNPDPEQTEQDRINKGLIPGNQRRFQVSKTYANAPPLKSVKLANPFPEPVKMMMSRTVSDDEKAEQMLAESKSQKTFSDWASKTPFRSFSTNIRRWYSKNSKSSKMVGSDSGKCKKLGKQQKKGTCPKMRLAGCAPPARSVCDRIPRHLDCKKQEAPYPAYSEFCHEEIDEKPSECKLCPWKSEENPNFKAPKKHFHTSSSIMVRRSGLEVETADSSSLDGKIILEDLPEGMQCDLRKPACEKPKNRRCPPGSTKEDKHKKGKEEKKKSHPPGSAKEEKHKKGEKKKSHKEKPKHAASVAEILNEERIIPAEEVEDVNAYSLKDTKKKHEGSLKNTHKKPEESSCKVKKFKFPGCAHKKRGVHEEKEVGKCPPKKKRIGIRDCPPSGEEGKACEAFEEVVGYSMREGERKDRPQKCPKVDLTTWKEEEEDPCKLKRKGSTKICPGDLMKKKHRKKRPGKKTEGITTPPVDSKKEPPQPVKTI